MAKRCCEARPRLHQGANPGNIGACQWLHESGIDWPGYTPIAHWTLLQFSDVPVAAADIASSSAAGLPWKAPGIGTLLASCKAQILHHLASYQTEIAVVNARPLYKLRSSSACMLCILSVNMRPAGLLRLVQKIPLATAMSWERTSGR